MTTPDNGPNTKTLSAQTRAIQNSERRTWNSSLNSLISISLTTE